MEEFKGSSVSVLWKNLKALPSAYEDFAEMGGGTLVEYVVIRGYRSLPHVERSSLSL